MKFNLWVLLFLGFAASGHSAEPTAYSFDSDVRRLSRIGFFNFGGVGFGGATTSGEFLLRRIAKKDDALKYFMEVYNTGSPEAKVYALAFFHHSAPELFEICWKDNFGKYNPNIKFGAGCLMFEGSFLEQMIRIREGQYDHYIEQALKRPMLSFAGGR